MMIVLPACTQQQKILHLAGVRVRDPHSHRVWTESESRLVRQGMEVGIPLRVALEGEQADRFRLDVTGCINASGEESAQQCRCQDGVRVLIRVQYMLL